MLFLNAFLNRNECDKVSEYPIIGLHLYSLKRIDTIDFLEYNQKFKSIFAYREQSMNSSAAILITALMGATTDCPKPETSVKYDRVYCQEQDVAVVQQGERFGMINLQGELIIPVEYEDFDLMDNGNFIAKKNGKFGIIDRKNTIIAPFVYDSISAKIGKNINFAVMVKDNKAGISNTLTGDVILSHEYDDIFPHNTQQIIYLIQKQNNQTKIGFADYTTGQILLKPTYDDYRWVYQKPLVIVKLNGKYGVINHDMQTVLPMKFDDIKWMTDRFYAYTGDKVAYFDEHGKEIK